MIEIHTSIDAGKQWITNYRDCSPVFACVLGFTDTGLIPGISAAGRTPEDRKYTALADAEFLYYGNKYKPKYPLPPLVAGASPVMISRAVVEGLSIPMYLFNAGLPVRPQVPTIDLGGSAAKCLSSGVAMQLSTVHHLLEKGLLWGEKLASEIKSGYAILGECVVGGTTTALAILTGLGIEAAGKVNSSHPICNHEQKLAVVQAGLARACIISYPDSHVNPLQLVAAVGDPMQIVVASMAIALSRSCGVLLAGGTQMLAVYALIKAISQARDLFWCPEKVVVGTTRWVAQDPTGSTIELTQLLGKVRPPLLATKLNFHNSRYPQLRAYEQGFVKEGMGAGGLCIAAHLKGWDQHQLLQAIEAQLDQYQNVTN